MKLFIDNKKSFKLSNLILLISVLFLVFFAPLLPVSEQRIVNSAGFTVIFFAAALSLDRFRREIFILALGAIFSEWLTDYINSEVFKTISDSINFIFFIIVVGSFITQLIRSQSIGFLQIMEAINGYLLLGIIFSIMISIVYKNFPNAFIFPESPKTFGDLMYYGFITLSTLGYGDVLPKLPVAKSLAILTTVSGQFYIATIIAIIISKYNTKSDSRDEIE